MTSAVQQILLSFDSLSEEEQRQAAVEVLKRVDQMTPHEIPEEAFVEAGASLFQQLDAEEALNGETDSQAR